VVQYGTRCHGNPGILGTIGKLESVTSRAVYGGDETNPSLSAIRFESTNSHSAPPVGQYRAMHLGISPRAK
jgi:hypothetical protein